MVAKRKAKPKPKKPVRIIKPGEAPGRGSSPGARGQQARFVATEEQRRLVAALRSCGWSQENISLATKLPRTTLNRHFAKEMETGEMSIKSKISHNIIEGAMNGDRTLMIFYAKTQMGWKDRASIGFEDDKGQPINPAGLFTVNISG